MVSESFPPNQEPNIDPKPKKTIIVPTYDNEKCKSSCKYLDKNGKTIVPALLINVTSVSIQISREKPWKLEMYLRNAF